MNFVRYLLRSFSARLSLWVTGFVTAIFVVALTLVLRFSMSVVKEESLEQNMEVLEHAALQADRMIHQAEMTAKTAAWMMSQHREQKKVIDGLCHDVMQANPWIDSCYVVAAGQQEAETARWLSPQLDAASDIVDLKPLPLTYLLPVADAAGQPLLTLVISVMVDWKDIVRQHVTDPLPYAKCYLVGAKSDDRGEKDGYELRRSDNGERYHFYRPLSHTEWGLMMVCSERDIIAGYNRLWIISILVMVAVLLLLLLVCRLVIDYNLKPLDLLSGKVRRISQNRFDEPIPAPKRLDEIGELQTSFSTMQQSLANHLSEMHHKTEELQKRNEALQVAYERGREDERIKTVFLSTISEKIMEPVSEIQAATDRLCVRYQDFTKEEMNQLQQVITANSDRITKLIDQTLKVSQGGEREEEI